MSKKDYDTCEHQWSFHIDADKSGFPASKPWASFYICHKCQHVINFLEKSSLDQLIAQNTSLKIQESHTKNGMRANIISSILMLTAILSLIAGQFAIKT
jgi:hypothetical protein